jgi:predicted acylesterase/phospholipase RssA
VLASASFPGAFECVRLDEKGPGSYQYVSSPTAHAYADGGILDNYPEEIFDRERYIATSKTVKDEARYNPETFGMCLQDKPVIADLAEHKPTLKPMPQSAPVTYLTALVNGCTSGQQNILFREHHDEKRTIFIDKLGVSTTATIDQAMRDKLIASGDAAVATFFGVEPTPAETLKSIAATFAAKRVSHGCLYAPKAITMSSSTVKEETACSQTCVIL